MTETQKEGTNHKLTSKAAEILVYLRSDPSLIVQPPLVGRFPANSPNNMVWIERIGLIISPLEETTDVHRLANTFNRIATELHPKSMIHPAVHKYAKKMMVGNMVFDEALLKLETESSTARFTVLGEEFNEGLIKEALSPIGVVSFEGFAGATSGKVTASDLHETVVLRGRTDLYLFPTSATAEEAAGKNLLPYIPAVIDHPIIIRKDVAQKC